MIVWTRGSKNGTPSCGTIQAAGNVRYAWPRAPWCCWRAWSRPRFCALRAAQRLVHSAAELRHATRGGRDSFLAVTVPATLGVEVGNLIYEEDSGGRSEIIGRIIGVDGLDEQSVVVRILPASATNSSLHRGGMLMGARPTLEFQDAVKLLLSPDSPSEEAGSARCPVAKYRGAFTPCPDEEPAAGSRPRRSVRARGSR